MELHLTERELVMAMDGELGPRETRRVHDHLAACWTCRAHMREIQDAVAAFVDSESSDYVPTAVDAPRAMLRARLSELAEAPREPWWTRFRLSPTGWAWASVVLGLLVALLAYDQVSTGRRAPSVVWAAPNPQLTPGAAVLEGTRELCAQTPPQNKEVSAGLRERVLAEYGVSTSVGRAYEVDYLITPALGGADDIHNLWPQPYRDTEWNARVKDALEDRLRGLVCSGELDLPTAQREIASNWIGAYKKYFHTDKPIQSAP